MLEIMSRLFLGNSLRFWSRISKADARKMVLVYAGLMDQKRKEGTVFSWRSFGKTLPLEI